MCCITQAHGVSGLPLVDGAGNELPVAQAVVRPFARAVAGDAVKTGFDTATSTFTLAWAPSGEVTTVSLPSRAYPSGYDVELEGGCYDVTSVPGQMLVQPDPAAAVVTLTVTPR